MLDAGEGGPSDDHSKSGNHSRRSSQDYCHSTSSIAHEDEEDQLVYRACNYTSFSDLGADHYFRRRSNGSTNRTGKHAHDAGAEFCEGEEHDEQLAKDLDFHCLILCSGQPFSGNNKDNAVEKPLPFTAEQVLNEIDALLEDEEHLPHEELNESHDIEEENKKEEEEEEAYVSTTVDQVNSNSSTLAEDLDPITSDSGLPETTQMSDSLCLMSSEQNFGCISGSVSSFSLDEQQLHVRKSAQTGLTGSAPNLAGIEKSLLSGLTICQLNELFLDLERMIQQLSEVLIQQLALRDELEFEKEQKNTFISLLLSIQNKRRKQNLQRKGPGRPSEPGKHLSTVIPYPVNSGPPDSATIQVLIKSKSTVNLKIKYKSNEINFNQFLLLQF